MTLADEIRKLNAEIERLTTVRDYLQERANGTRTRRPARGSVTAAEAAARVLERAEGPMRTRDLFDAVLAEGAQLKDSEGLTKTLRRAPDRFKKTGRGMWTLA